MQCMAVFFHALQIFCIEFRREGDAMEQSNTIQFVVTETFGSENLQERKEAIQRMIDTYLSMKVSP